MTGPRWTPVQQDGSGSEVEYKLGSVFLGAVIWFTELGPYYAHSHNKRLGSFATREAAMTRVEYIALVVASTREPYSPIEKAGVAR